MSKIKSILDDDQKHQAAETPTEESEQSVRNVLDNAHKMGIYEKADEEHPQELGLGEEVNDEEEERLGED